MSEKNRQRAQQVAEAELPLLYNASLFAGELEAVEVADDACGDAAGLEKLRATCCTSSTVTASSMAISSCDVKWRSK